MKHRTRRKKESTGPRDPDISPRLGPVLKTGEGNGPVINKDARAGVLVFDGEILVG
jgi:hypothetical protein